MTDQTIVVADHGDVFLKIGEGEHIIKIRVDSRILLAASKPFKAMLGPNFVDGKGISHEKPKEIPLADDDPEAMQAILQILHFKNHAITKDLKSHTILKIAQASNKHLLHEAMSFAMYR